MKREPFNRSVNVSSHAIDRAVERLGQTKHFAEQHIRQLLAASNYHGETPAPNGKRDIYIHRKTGTTIVIDPSNNIVVTVYKAEEQSKSAASITVDRIANAVKREFKRMQTEVTREVRKLSEQVAIMHAEAAQLNVNKIRCRAPHTQLLIQARIDDILTRADELAKVIDVKLTEIERAKSEVQAVAGE